MCRTAVLFLFLAASCASAPIRQCIQVAGTFAARAACTRAPKTAKFFLSDDAVFENVKTVVVDQTGCSLHFRATGDAGATGQTTLVADDLRWNDIGADFTWTPRTSGPNILPGASREERTISIKLSDDHNVLTLTSGYDDHGLALLFVPFHEHKETTCVFMRDEPAAQ